MKEFVIN